MTKVEYADQLHNMKYNCAQAVVCAYAEEMGVDKAILFRMAEGFGGGMGDTRGVCGALTGACMLAGLKNSDANLEDPKTKGATYKIMKEMNARFEEECGSRICRELKGVDTGVVLKRCPECIAAGVKLAQEILGLPEE